MRKKRLKILRLTRNEWLVVAAIDVVLLIIFLPVLIRMWKEEVPQVHNLMRRIYNKMEKGYSRQEILSQMSRREKRLIQKHKVAWDSSVFPVKTRHGTLKPTFYPPDHVVVYSELLIQYEHKQVREASFLTGQGQMPGLSKVSDLEALINVTRFGTSEILLGRIADINDIPATVDVNEYHQVYSYLLLKKLMVEDSGFLKYAVLLASRKDLWTNKWLANILNSTVTSPPLPELNANFGYVNDFYKNLSDWYSKNGDRIKMTNIFLFEE